MSTEEDKIEKIGKIAKTGTKSAIEEVAEEQAQLAKSKERFDAALVNTQAAEKVQADKASPPERIEPAAKTSLMDEVRNINARVDRFDKISPTQLVAQSDEVIKQIEAIKQKLSSSDLSLHPSTQNLLQNKLSHIDENLRVALSKAGLEYNPSTHLDNKKVNPVERFLGFLTHGQAQLATLSNEVTSMHLNNKEITPANMLRIQMKMGYITQEIEFFTAVLNKALDSTKTIMNIQV